jgi:hypothetical protein
MIRMIATTISNSISEKPFCCFRISSFPFLELFDGINVRTCLAKLELP